MSKPSILLVPGSFTPGHAYNNLVEKVAASGYDIRALQMPSVRLETESPTTRKPPTMYEDASFIAGQVKALADQGRDVVIVSHSYGGVPATECVKGLAKDARKRLGKQGGIVRLAYMTALAPALGSSAAQVLDMGERPEHDRLPMEADEEGEAWAGVMTAHSAISFGDPLTHAGYKDVPVSYLICEEDLVIPDGSQSRMVDMIEQEGSRRVDITKISAGHAPNITAKQAVVDWIIHVAEKGGNQDVQG